MATNDEILDKYGEIRLDNIKEIMNDARASTAQGIFKELEEGLVIMIKKAEGEETEIKQKDVEDLHQLFPYGQKIAYKILLNHISEEEQKYGVK